VTELQFIVPNIQHYHLRLFLRPQKFCAFLLQRWLNWQLRVTTIKTFLLGFNSCCPDETALAAVFLHDSFWRRIFGFFTGWIPSHHPKKQCQNAKGNLKHRTQQTTIVVSSDRMLSKLTAVLQRLQEIFGNYWTYMFCRLDARDNSQPSMLKC